MYSQNIRISCQRFEKFDRTNKNNKRYWKKNYKQPDPNSQFSTFCRYHSNFNELENNNIRKWGRNIGWYGKYIQDCSQLTLSLTLIEIKHQIELGLKEKASKKHRQYKVANMKAAVDEWADFSAQQLENRLDRIWKQKQKEVNCLDI